MSRTITKIIVHHTADASGASQFDKVDRYHESRGFPKSKLGYFVGYHYFIERDGKVKQARLDSEVGAHDKGENYESIGIGLAGNFDEEFPTNAQIDALQKLLVKLVTVHELSWQVVVPHRIGDATSCYGSNLSDSWGQEQCIIGLINVLVTKLYELQKHQ